MDHENKIPAAVDESESHRAVKKPYQEPAFRFERVFETMALACGKIQATTFECRFHRNSS